MNNNYRQEFSNNIFQDRALCCLYCPIFWFIHPEWTEEYLQIGEFAWELFIPWCKADFKLCSKTWSIKSMYYWNKYIYVWDWKQVTKMKPTPLGSTKGHEKVLGGPVLLLMERLLNFFLISFSSFSHKIINSSSTLHLRNYISKDCHPLHYVNTAGLLNSARNSLQKKRQGWAYSLSSGCSHWCSVGMKIPLQTFIKQQTLCNAESSMWRQHLSISNFLGKEENNYELLQVRIAPGHRLGLSANAQCVPNFKLIRRPRRNLLFLWQIPLCVS